ncbi:MAG: 3-phosphoshikimate 1-carboxyvinyltransferase [Planctomycetes bacterium]|nr:3-phosphoshikimate 1-carboxyvinyltransferase [Planctomycetota bacterium]
MTASAKGGLEVHSAPRATGPVRGAFLPPGSKSLTQRFMMLAALAEGSSTIDHPLDSADTRALGAGLATLGASVRWPERGPLVIRGVDGTFPGFGNLDAVDGGTPARFLMAAACLASGSSVLDGSARLRQRPMQDGVSILNSLGATLKQSTSAQLPITITPTQEFRKGGSCRIPAAASSQFISALALIGPWLTRGVEVRLEGEQPSLSYIDLTVHCLRKVGAAAAWRASEGVLRVEPTRLKAFHVAIEPDASSAAYGLALAAIMPGSEVTVAGLPRSSHQPDMAVFDALVELGAVDCSTAGGSAIRYGSRLNGGVLDASRWPDGSLAVMAAAAFASAPVEIRGLSTLAGKESDRIEAMGAWLQAAGATVECGGDWIRVDGRSLHDRQIVVDPRNDHRIAMSAAVAGAARGGVRISDPACVGKSWPGFWPAWQRLVAGFGGST